MRLCVLRPRDAEEVLRGVLDVALARFLVEGLTGLFNVDEGDLVRGELSSEPDDGEL